MASPEILLPATPARTHDANMSKGEQSLPLFHLPAMQSEGLKHRTGPGHESDISRDESGLNSMEETLTSTSSRQSSIAEDSFIKTTRRRLSHLIDSGAAARADEEERRMHDYGYHLFIKEKPANAAKYPKGFPRLAAWTSDEDDRSIYRRFKYLRNREILQLEVELTELEYDLEELDKADSMKEAAAIQNGKWKGPEYRLRCTRHEEDWNDNAQRDLLKTILDKLNVYDQLVFAQARYEALEPASERAHRNYFDISKDTSLTGRYGDFLLHQDDFVSTVTTHSSWVHQLIQHFIDKKPNCLVSRVFRILLHPEGAASSPKDTPHDETLPNITYFSTTAFDRLTTGILVILCVGILLIPAFLMFLLPMNHPLMATIAAIFIILCALFMSTTTDADPYKVFVGTATYAALVIMFLGNLGASCAAA